MPCVSLLLRNSGTDSIHNRQKRTDMVATFFAALAMLFLVTTIVLVLVLVASRLLVCFSSYLVINGALADDDGAEYSFMTDDYSRIVVPEDVERTTHTTTGKSLLVGRLLCTLRSGFSRKSFVFPADGVCAIITFNSLYVPGGSTLSPPYHVDLDYFLETANHHQETEYGIGIDHDFCRNDMLMTALVEKYTTKMYLNKMWSYRVYHYGQVNTPAIIVNGNTIEYVTQSAKGLQV
ncbi:hypothetical protein HPB49_007195 [Dermacentor silvarum]|uniref:Uncharacterized protein n=1 Tax=Dermacentor silvarum TaxID=543639 RepID=A0ACB8CVP8_DERSI|nr:hypothetical protein HPB49_007195 [Dermacentor silvarum]